jgi:vacuolar-type H+-ATPase subunit H
MELIKKIKQSESEAREIIEKAKAEALKQAEAGRESRLAAMTEAEHQRKQATEAAIAEARSQANAEVENIKAQAEDQRRQLRDKTADRMTTAAAKVMDYLRG